MNYNIDKYIINEDNSARFVLGMDSRNPLFVIGVNPGTADDRNYSGTLFLTNDEECRRVVDILS